MMPAPEEIATIVDRAERIVESANGRLMRLSREDRRRMITEELYEQLRRDGQEPFAVRVPVSGR